MTPPFQLSERAEHFLKAKQKKSRTSKGELAELLGAAGLDCAEAHEQFEDAFGGWVIESSQGIVSLGIRSHKRKPARLPDGGLWASAGDSPDGELYIAPDGRIACAHPDGVRVISSSAAKLLEKHAMFWWLEQWCPQPFAVLLSAPGQRLAKALGLARDDDASDSFWEAHLDETFVMFQQLQGDSWSTGFVDLHAQNINDAVGALCRLADHFDDLRVAVGGVAAKRTDERHRSGYGQPPEVTAPERWETEPNARRFDLLAEGGRGGVVYAFGPPGQRRFEQYELARGRSDAYSRWSSFSAQGGTVRKYFAPPKR